MSFLSQILNIFFTKVFDHDVLDHLPPAEPHSESHIFSLFNYRQKKVKEIIKHLKKHNDIFLKKDIAKKMHEQLMEYIFEQQNYGYFTKPYIIPVPISSDRLYTRGFNQTTLLAKELAKNIKGIYASNIIQKNKQTKKQALIKNRQERFSNIRGAFICNKKKQHLIKNKDVIVVDDLSTTGATFLEIEKTLKQAGARKVIGITIAH